MILPLFRRPTQPCLNLGQIEATVAQSHSLLDENRVAAFTVESSRGRGLVVIAEVSRRLHRIWDLDLTGDENPLIAEIQAAIRKSVYRRHRIQVDAVMLVPRHTLSRDPHGAIDRAACRSAYLGNAFTQMDRICA